jgi:hypothetical protein
LKAEENRYTKDNCRYCQQQISGFVGGCGGCHGYLIKVYFVLL